MPTTPTYCAPTPANESDLAVPAVLPVAAAANMAAPTGLTAVAPAEFPLPCGEVIEGGVGNQNGTSYYIVLIFTNNPETTKALIATEVTLYDETRGEALSYVALNDAAVNWVWDFGNRGSGSAAGLSQEQVMINYNPYTFGGGLSGVVTANLGSQTITLNVDIPGV